MMLADVCAEVLAHIVDPAQAKLGILPGLSSEALELPLGPVCSHEATG